LVGGSGAGKTTLAKYLETNGDFQEAISTTTRPKRDGETEGVNYYYVSTSQFEEQKANGKFLEVVTFNGNSYGGSEGEMKRIFDIGKTPVFVVEPEGANQIAQWCRAKSSSDEGYQVAPLLVYISCDYELTKQRFIERTSDAIAKISNPAISNNDVQKEINILVDRLAIAGREESMWAHALSYDLIVGPMLNSSSSLVAIKSIETEISSGDPSALLRQRGITLTKLPVDQDHIRAIRKEVIADLLENGIVNQTNSTDTFSMG
jgi:guanylate kinase